MSTPARTRLASPSCAAHTDGAGFPGFGARFPNGQVSHCFALNGSPDASCRGVEEIAHFCQCPTRCLPWPAAVGLLGADCAGCLTDRQAVANLQLYGPTNFAEFINTTAEIARHADVSQHNQQYFVLLVLTDGVITDMEKTVSEIVNASTLPLSIIIVGNHRN